MMQLYRAVLQPRGSFCSPLQSDTLFGAFCWSYRYLYGESELEAWLENMQQNGPELIFSNAFPAGTLPLPLGIYDTSADFEKIESKQERKKAYQNNKKLKSAKYIKREWFDRIAVGDHAGFTVGLMEDGLQEQTTMHNMVCRSSGTVENIDGSGSLFEESEFFSKPGTSYDVYILTSLPEEQVKKLVQLMLHLGIGSNKSTGKGAFELIDWKSEPPFACSADCNAFVALSNFVPAQKDPTEGVYKTLVKYGKLDREYAASEIPFKKPLLFLQAGAVFHTNEIRPYYGRIVGNIAAQEKIVVNGCTIAMPIRL